MSFNPNDNNPLMISRDNYEEYFLLYIDNELNEEERKAVEAFVLLHPDLQAELEILMTTKLPADDISLAGKESLFADSMKLNAIDESLLLYIDDELKGEDKKIVEQKIEKDKNYGLQHQLLLKTKLDKTEKFVYPHKEELYRREEKRRPIYWMRAAAAVIVVLGIGAAIWTTNSGSGDQIEVAQGPKTVKPKVNSIEPQTTPLEQPANGENLASTEVKNDKIKSEQHNTHRDEFIAVSKGIEATKKSNNDVEGNRNEITETPQVANNNIAIKDPVQKEEDVVAKIDPSETGRKQSFNDQPVTTSSNGSYNNQTAPTAAVLKDVAVDNEKKSSLKGLLRKATRFIERRTNIKATNEDDELLIGAVAIQL